jgi:transposase-like protein
LVKIEWTKEQKIDIIRSYTSREYSYREIAKNYGVNRDVIREFLRNNNVEAILRKPLTEQEKIKVIELYKTGKYNFRSLARQVNKCESTIDKFLKKNGFKAILHGKPRLYPINEDFFDDINTQEKAYIVGLLYADGCNSKNYRVSIALQERDKEILERIRDLISPSRPLNYCLRGKPIYKNAQNVYNFNISNKHISKRLSELGMTQAKTFTITFPYWINENLIRHFLRGVIDGDGYISKNLKNPKISFISTLSFCISAKEIFSNILSVKSYIYTHKNCRNTNIRYLEICGRDRVIKFLDWIYQDSTIHLQRKYECYLTLKENVDNRIKCTLADTKVLL